MQSRRARKVGVPGRPVTKCAVKFHDTRQSLRNPEFLSTYGFEGLNCVHGNAVSVGAARNFGAQVGAFGNPPSCDSLPINR